MRDLRPELFVEAYKKTGMRPLRGAWYRELGTRKCACPMTVLAVHESRWLAVHEHRCFIPPGATATHVADALGMPCREVAHFANAFDDITGSHPEATCSCDICRAAQLAKDAIVKEIGDIVGAVPEPLVIPL